MLPPSEATAPTLAACPLCGHRVLTYQFTHLGTPIVRCAECGLLMRNPQPTDAELSAIYTDGYFLGAGPAGEAETDRLKRATANHHLDAIERRAGGRASGCVLLELGCGRGNLLVEAQARGYRVMGIDYSAASVASANQKLGAPLVQQGTLASAALADASVDVVVMADVLEHTRDPLAELIEVWRVLKPGGWLFLAVPSLDSWSARLMRQRWMEFKLEHLFFFDEATIGSLLFRAGFDQVRIRSGWKTLSVDYMMAHFERFPVPVFSPLASALRRLTPGRLRRKQMSVVASGIDVTTRRSPLPPLAVRPVRLTVIIPLYNERATFRTVFDQVYAKAIPGVETDIIVVESGSTDGSAEAAQEVASLPRVQVLHQPRAFGKGHAVRAALDLAEGDLVLVQDADLEYDVNDYDQLVAPLVSGRAAFVLGVRHDRRSGSMKLRQFTEQPIPNVLMGFGHVAFRTLFNVVYGQRLRDPFTMYKVFRRDCLDGLTLESNRFDFDWELVAKLVRAGYAPLEIPVNYMSRNFKQGKKVRLWRDPFTYLRACVKYRFVPVRKRQDGT